MTMASGVLHWAASWELGKNPCVTVNSLANALSQLEDVIPEQIRKFMKIPEEELFSQPMSALQEKAGEDLGLISYLVFLRAYCFLVSKLAASFLHGKNSTEGFG